MNKEVEIECSSCHPQSLKIHRDHGPFAQYIYGNMRNNKALGAVGMDTDGTELFGDLTPNLIIFSESPPTSIQLYCFIAKERL